MQVEPPVLLVVEDDFLVRLTLVDALSDGGFEVLEAADAKEALTLVCDRDDISAMLTDINLPGGSDGFALARAARVIRPALPVVYASGRYGGAEEGQAVDGSRFLAKPFTPSLAAGVIHDLIDPGSSHEPTPSGIGSQRHV
jgi:two-component system, response regulator PdtaR